MDTSAVHGVVTGHLADGTARVMITGGANQAGTISRLPAAGNRFVFGPHHKFYPSPELPADVPWTHLLPARANPHTRRTEPTCIQLTPQAPLVEATLRTLAG